MGCRLTTQALAIHQSQKMLLLLGRIAVLWLHCLLQKYLNKK